MIEVGLIILVCILGAFAMLIIETKNRVEEVDDSLRSESERLRTNQQELFAEIYEDRQAIKQITGTHTLLDPPEKPVDGNYEYDPDDYRDQLTTHQRVNLKG